MCPPGCVGSWLHIWQPTKILHDLGKQDHHFPLITPTRRPQASPLLSQKDECASGPLLFSFPEELLVLHQSDFSSKVKEAFCGHTPLSPVTSITYSCLVFVTSAPNSLICFLVYCLPYLPQEYKFPRGRFLVLFTISPKQRQCLAHNRCSISIF